jgi:hypothetical protein
MLSTEVGGLNGSHDASIQGRELSVPQQNQHHEG